MACTNLPKSEPIEFRDNAQFVLTNYSHDLRFSPKSGTNLQVIRLGDFTVFDSNLQVTYNTEFKSTYKLVDPSKIDDLFAEKFSKSPLVNQQLIDINAKKGYTKIFGDSSIKVHDLEKLHLNDYDSTNKFKLGRHLATK